MSQSDKQSTTSRNRRLPPEVWKQLQSTNNAQSARGESSTTSKNQSTTSKNRRLPPEVWQQLQSTNNSQSARGESNATSKNRQATTVGTSSTKTTTSSNRRIPTMTSEPSSLPAIETLSINDNDQRPRPRPVLDPFFLYATALSSNKRLHILGRNEAAALAGWESFKLTKKFVIVSPIVFMDEERNPVVFYKCACTDAIDQRERFNGWTSDQQLSEAAINAEHENYCIHAKALEFHDVGLLPVVRPPPEHEDDEVDDDPEIERLGSDFLWSVWTKKGYGIVKRTHQGRFKCVSCNNSGCVHLNRFNKDKLDVLQDVSLPLSEAREEAFVVSSKPIVYDKKLTSKFKYPVVDDLDPSSCDVCIHGNRWKLSSKRQVSIIYNKDGRPYNAGYIWKRLADGPCRCREQYDGSDHGLININNRQLVEYTLLRRYMNTFSTDGTPLVAFHTALAKENSDDDEKTIPFALLHRAWTGFVALLTFDERFGFQCRNCGEKPKTIVLDGTTCACHARLIPKMDDMEMSDQPRLNGLSHDERVFVSKQQTRKLLRQFADKTPKKMSLDDVRNLVERITLEFPLSGLLELILRLTAQDECEADSAYEALLVELSKNTPIMGLFQGGLSDDALDALERVALNEIDIASVADSELVARMRIWYPGLLNCLRPIRKSAMDGRLPDDVCNVVTMMIDQIRQQLATISQHVDDQYVPISGDGPSTGFFPCWPLQRGRGRYVNEQSKPDEADTCTKHKHGHQVLGPGIMLYLCEHGTTYGFSVMESYESPRMPFDVFTSRYTPTNIVYDNACKLHLYCLRREPYRFKESRFFVDRFHWLGHKACSRGYSLNEYSTDRSISTMNSGVTEQLNSRIKNLKRSLSYMTYKNFKLHLKLFLFLRNQELRCEL